MRISYKVAAILIVGVCFNGYLAEAQVVKFLANIKVPSAGYLIISNESNKDIEISKIKSDDFDRIEVHQTTTKNNQTSMRKISKLTIQAKDNLELKSGGIHLMLFSPKKTLKHNDLTELHFFDDYDNIIFSKMFTLKNRAENY